MFLLFFIYFFIIKISSLLIIVSYLILLYFFLILYLTYFIYYLLTKKNKITQIEYISLIKDREFINFKGNLFNFYYSILVIFFIFLFKINSFYLLLDLDKYFLFFNFISIFVITLILVSNFFILFLFNIYLKFKICINKLNNINIYSNSHLKNIFINYNSFYKPFSAQARSFSTNSKNIREFKKAYGGGFLGYTYSYNFGNITQFTSYVNN